LHGTGGDENSLVPFAQTLLPGAAILSPRGRILERGMPRFFRRFAEGVFDYDNIREEADALAAFVSAAAEEYELDPAKVTAIGYSNGANAAWSALLRHPELASELVLFRPMVTLAEETPSLTGKRIWVGAGRYDPIVPNESVDQLVEQMRALGADVTVNWLEGGHELTRQEIDVASTWLGAA
jgi:predicted esterase